MESTTLASPAVTIQSILFQITDANQTQVNDVFSIIVDNAVGWADKGWGGSIRGAALVYVNPVLDNASAKESMAPLIDYATKLQNAGVAVVAVVTEFPSWGAFYDSFSAILSTVSQLILSNSFGILLPYRVLDITSLSHLG